MKDFGLARPGQAEIFNPQNQPKMSFWHFLGKNLSKKSQIDKKKFGTWPKPLNSQIESHFFGNLAPKGSHTEENRVNFEVCVHTVLATIQPLSSVSITAGVRVGGLFCGLIPPEHILKAWHLYLSAKHLAKICRKKICFY